MRWFGYAAEVGLLVGGAVHIATYLPVDLTALVPWIYVLHVGIFPPFFALIVAARRETRWVRDPFPTAVTAIPTALRVAAAVLFVYAVVNWAVFLAQESKGSPTAGGGSYFLNNHGRETPITRREYVRDVSIELRGFSGFWLVFYSLPAVYFRYCRPSLLRAAEET